MKFLHFFLFLTSLALIGTPFNVQARNNQTFSTENKLDKIVLQLKWFHQFNFAGYYAAVEKGFYRDAGLDVILKEGQPVMDFVEEVVSGRANFGVEMPELLIARNQGKPVVALAAIFQHSPQIILAREDSGIRSPQNLINKKVMWRYDSAAELRAMLLNEKVPLEKIDFVDLSWDISDLIEGKVDAIHAYITDQPLALEKEGIRSTILSPITYGIDFYGDCLFTSEKELFEHPERVKAFREASIKGWEYAMNNPEELIEIIQKKYPTKSTKEYMRHEVTHIKELMLPKLIEIGHMNPGRWKHIGDTFVRLGMINPDYTLDGFLYDPNPQPDYSKIVWALFLLTMTISLSALFLFVFNRKLKRQVEERTKHLSSEIAQRKEVELKYFKQNAEFQAIFNSITDAIVFVDLERSIVMTNPAFTSILGYELGEVKGKKTQFFYANPDDFQQTGKERFREGAEIVNPVYEVDYRRKDGSVFTGETLGIHVKDIDQNTIGYLGIIRDITNRKKAEEEKANLEKQLRQAYKMEAIGTMAGGIAHDFNNILAIILGNADMAKDDIPDNNPAKYNIEQVLKASNRAKELVRQILTFSRKSEQELLPIQPCSVIKESLKLLRSTTPTSISLMQDICEEDCKILADPTQFHQLLMNLFTNAVHAMEERGTINVCVKIVDFNLSEIQQFPDLAPGKHLKVKISDTGTGMDKETLDRIFDPFFTTKDVNEGTGMGLSIVHGIVSSHNGFIDVQSEPGGGTTFSIFFPIIEGVMDQESHEVEEEYPRGDERILFVDDEEMLAEMGSRILERQGYHVTSKTNSLEALDVFKSSPDTFDLVVTDQSMPDMTGSELAVELLKVNPKIPIILCTGFSKKVSEKTAKDFGIKDFCLKPLDRKSLSNVVRRALDESKIS